MHSCQSKPIKIHLAFAFKTYCQGIQDFDPDQSDPTRSIFAKTFSCSIKGEVETVAFLLLGPQLFVAKSSQHLASYLNPLAAFNESLCLPITAIANY